ncbi:MAG: hypothetical protein HY924_06470 [Elusimicrobia bacterium]|nr:hypothetical protein [Elusimicrobiota bacterium]
MALALASGPVAAGPAQGLPDDLAKPSADTRFSKARRLLDLIGEQDAESLRRTIWKQFKQSQAKTVSKEDTALLAKTMDVEPLRNALTHLWAKDFIQEDLDASIAFFVSEPGKAFLAACEGYPGPYWRPLLAASSQETPSFAKARRLAEAAGAFDKCRSGLAAKASAAGASLDPAAARDAAARHYLKTLDDRTRNTALLFFESGAGRQFERSIRKQGAEGPGLFRLWLTGWVAEAAQQKLRNAPGPEHTDARRGFSLIPPPGWAAAPRGGAVVFRAGGEPKAAKGAPSISVRSEPGRDFPKFLQSVEDRLESGVKDFILRFKEDVHVDGRDGLLVTYLHKEKDDGVAEDFKSLALVVDGGKRFWTVTCRARARDFEKVRVPCRQSLLSFKVL